MNTRGGKVIDFPKTEWADDTIGQHREPLITMATERDCERCRVTNSRPSVVTHVLLWILWVIAGGFIGWWLRGFAMAVAR